MLLDRRPFFVLLLALAGLPAGVERADAGAFTVKVFNSNGTLITNDTVTLYVYDSADNLLYSCSTATGVFTVFSVSSSQTDESLKFVFTRKSVGTPTLTLNNIFGDSGSTQVVDAIVPT